MSAKKINFWKIETDFPDPTCGYKWAWSTVNLMSGETSSCHRVHGDYITAENFSTFHNTKTKIKTRQKMLDGEWPGLGCEYCRDIEHAGGLSDRLDFNTNEYNVRYVPGKLNGTHADPTILEMYFTNLCNLGCIYCAPRYSSVLEAEAKKFPEITWPITDARRPDTYEDRLNAFWKWFDTGVNSLRKYHILGGEPFFQKELIDNIEFFEKRCLPELELAIFSNLKVPEEKFKNLLTRLENLKKDGKLKSVRIVCSLDCWGPQQEYIRTGLNINNWKNNFETLVHDFKYIDIEIHGTVTALSVKTMPELIYKWKKWDTIRKPNGGVVLSYNICFNPSHMHPGIFPKDYFKKEFDLMYNTLNHTGPEYETLKGFELLINNTARDKSRISKLRDELRGFDSRRGTDHETLFPWFVKYCEEVL